MAGVKKARKLKARQMWFLVEQVLYPVMERTCEGWLLSPL
jgi:hypothetical protein